MRKLHRWGGWALGAFLVLQAVTGLICAFRGEINGLLYEPNQRAGDPARAAGTIVEQFSREFPELRFERLFFPGSLMGETAVVWARATDMDLHIAVYDPGTAQLLKAGPVTAFPAELVFFFHVQLLSGRAGQAVVGVLGVLLAVMSITGYVRWRRTSSLSRVSAAKAGAYARWLGRHRSIGIVVVLVGVLLGVTGAFLGLKVLASPAPQAPPVALAREPLLAAPIDQAVAVARRTWPDGTLWSLTTDPAQPGRVTVIVRHRDGLPPRATDQLTFDTAAGTAAEVTFAGQPLKSRASAWAHGLHSGEWLGIAAKPLMIIAGLGLGAMAVLGYALTAMRLSQLKRASGRGASACRSRSRA